MTAKPGMLPPQLAKGALRRLAQARLEPTPENYARAYAAEAAEAAESTANAAEQPGDAPTRPLAPAIATSVAAHGGADWVAALDRATRGLERSSKGWTVARRKSSLRQVLDGSRSDPGRLLQRLQSLLGAWETDSDEAVDNRDSAAAAGATEPAELLPESSVDSAAAAPGAQHREALLKQLQALVQALSQSLVELAEDGGWVQGQARLIESHLGNAGSVRGVKAAAAVLAQARATQHGLRGEHTAARTAMAALIARMLSEVGTLDEQAGGWQQALERHAQAVQSADSLQSLAGVVQALLADSRATAGAVAATRARLAADRSHAQAMEARVQGLEQELRRVGEELATDALTQVANRRGLEQAFAAEAQRASQAAGAAADDQADGGATQLAVGLIDIDNFKRLNDSLGHAAGDQALKALASQVRERLRPQDHVARFGGEEFVLLLPGIAAPQAQQSLTRLQRQLSEALFLHDGKEVFVTFSAGVTAWRLAEPLQAALERADAALYEAKRTGKNRTCLG